MIRKITTDKQVILCKYFNKVHVINECKYLNKIQLSYTEYKRGKEKSQKF